MKDAVLYLALALSVIIGGLLGCGCSDGSKAWAELVGGAAALASDCGGGIGQDVGDIQAAIHNGGPSWVAVAFDAVGCLVPVIRDELRAHGVQVRNDAPLDVQLAELPVLPEITHARLAAAGPGLSVQVPVPSIDAAELRRMRIAVALETAMTAKR